MLTGDLVLGSVTDTYYSLFQKEIRKILTVTPSLFNQNHRISRHNISVTRYKSVIKKTATTGHQPVELTSHGPFFLLLNASVMCVYLHLYFDTCFITSKHCSLQCFTQNMLFEDKKVFISRFPILESRIHSSQY